jgi:hypothetical protein
MPRPVFVGKDSAVPELLADPIAPSCVHSAPAPSDAKHRARRQAVYLMPALVFAAAVALAAASYDRFLENPELLWSNAVHDRNAHYTLGLSLALDVQQGNVKALLHDLDGARIWPPLHGLLVAAVLFVGGPDYRLAVLPSLAAWVGTAVFGFLAARRATPRGGNLAGLVAALFILASPAHHAFATDIMLESLGACLSLLVVYLYLVAVQKNSVWACRWLALALTALFLEKYNYWLIVVLALVATEISYRPRALWNWLTATLAAIDWKRWAAAQVRRPTNYLLAAVLGLLSMVLLGRGETLQVAGHSISIHTTHNLVHAAYLIIFARLAYWWWKEKRGWTRGLEVRTQQLLLWHGLPIALWFLWPKRLSACLWSMSPTTAGDTPQYRIRNGVAYYWTCLTGEYHIAVWAAVLTLVLIVFAALAYRRMRAGGWILLWLVVIAAALTIRHPNQKSRFLHSWVAGGWVAAGVGLALCVNGPLTARWKRLRPWLATAAAGGLGLAFCQGFVQAGHAPEGGPDPQRASTLEITDSYLPSLAESQRATVVSTVPMKWLVTWTFLQRYGQGDRLETDLKGYGFTDEEHRQAFARWLETTPSDTLVFIDVPLGSTFYVPGAVNEMYGALREMLASQTVFHMTQRRELAHDGCAVTIWSRSSTRSASTAQLP